MTTDNNNDERRNPSLWVWLAASSALMSALTMGAVLGWSSPGIPALKLNGSEPQLPREPSETETWISSSMTLGALIGGLLGGPLLQMLGMKKVLIGLGAPFVVGWVLICVAKSFILIIIGRVITGFASGICCGVAPTYCIQISTPKIRGLLGTGFQIFVTIGIVYVDLFGLALGWRWLCIIGLIPAVIMSIGMIFMPESPSWLMNKYGRSSQVVSALRRLRTDDSDIEGELKELQDRAEKSKAESSGFSMAAFKRPDVYKPFIIANVLMFCQQFSGINAVLFNMNSIFEASGSSMDPMVATCIVNSAMVAATISGGLIIDRLGRKILLIASGVGHVVTLGVLGYYYYADSAGMGWLPVVCLVVFVVSFSIGFGPIPWMIVAEITPGFAMGVVSACGTAFNWLCAFIVTKQFEAIQKGLNKYGAFWMFAGISAGSVLFTVLFVPETKGRSLEEMQRIFRGEKVGVDVGPHDMSGEKKEKYSINKDVTTV